MKLELVIPTKLSEIPLTHYQKFLAVAQKFSLPLRQLFSAFKPFDLFQIERRTLARICIVCRCVCVVLGLGHAKVGFCVFGTHKSGFRLRRIPILSRR